MNSLILEYKDYIKSINEGLIKTYNIYKYHSSLDIQLNSVGIKSKIDIIDKFSYELEILNNKNINNKKNNDSYKYLISLNNNLGYYPSYIWVENDFGTNSFKFDMKYLNSKYKSLKIRFEAKYEDGLYKNDLVVPTKAYHLTDQRNKIKIEDIGLVPKSNNRVSFHQDRIYLFYNKNDYTTLLLSLRANDNKNNLIKQYVLFEVELNDRYIIHTDPNYNKGFFTYDNIPPNNIKTIKEKL